MTTDTLDPKGLIRESYRIDGITEGECRSIFLDWAIQVPETADTQRQILGLIDRYAPDFPDHPMTVTLRAGLATPARTGRRGGRSGRIADA
ncbi:MAG: hypothetical protein ACU0CI_08260 [Shimia sp.]